MDGERFDGITRALARSLGRRWLGRVLAGTLGALGLAVAGERDAGAGKKPVRCTRGKKKCGSKCCAKSQDCCKRRCRKKCPSGQIRSRSTSKLRPHALRGRAAAL